MAIPDAVLCKPGKLTDEEFEVMRSHTTRGWETLNNVAAKHPNNSFVSLGIEIARSHHEKWNGKGYPDGLEGDAIPVSAQIMAVADVYDALTSERVYKPPFTHDKAQGIITGDSGTHFAPIVVDAFVEIADEFNRVRKEMGN